MLERIKSNIRFSLSLRIATRYALFHLGATFSVMIFFSLAFAATILPEYINQGKEIISSYEAGGAGREGREASYGTELLSVRIQSPDGDVVYNGIFDDSFQYFRIADNTLYIRLGYRIDDNTSFLFIANTAPYQQQYFILVLTLLALDILRVFSILSRRKRLAKSVIKPINDMADAARNLSASNLDMRINILGTKNELRDLAIVINEMLDRIEAAYESQKAFVSDASHELRTPIAVIQGYARLLERWGASDPAVAAEAIAAISSETESMRDLVEKLLFLARHDKKTFKLELEVFDLADLCRELIRDTKLINQTHQIGEGLLVSAVVNADRSAVKQALRIFIDNAVKYTPAGGSISVSCEDLGSEVRASVTDTGPGMTREEAARSFDRFYRSDTARSSNISGHGLGLAIARLIAASHGGKIAVKTAPGEGSTFRILLKK